MPPPLLLPWKCRCTVKGCRLVPGGYHLVGRSTYFRHALADRVIGQISEVEIPPDNDMDIDVQEEEPLSVQDLLPLMEAKLVHEEDYQEDDGDEPPSEEDVFAADSLFHNWDQPLGVAGGTLLGELLLYYFEWMGGHTVTDASAQAVCGILTLLLPKDHSFPAFHELKKMLQQVHKNNVVKVDLCPNDCIAFHNAKHQTYAHYQHAHRTKCPKCGAARYLTDKKGKQVTAKVGYYFPMDDWMASNFKDKDLEQHRDNDTGEFPKGHTRLSRGWHEKMTRNPHMNVDPRNQGLIGMADGIPIFKDKFSRGVLRSCFVRCI